MFSKHSNVCAKRMITCSHCDRRVKKTSIWNHFECYGLRRVSTCPICLSRFESRMSMFKHMKTHPPNLKCNICHYFTHKRAFYVNHLKYSHIPAQLQQKLEYKKYFVGTNKVKIWWYKIPHVTKGVRVDGAVAVCVLCREICVDDEDMKSHISTHQPDLTLESLCKYITCNVCGERFVNKILHKYHKLKSMECREDRCDTAQVQECSELGANGGEAQIVSQIKPTVESNLQSIDQSV